MLVATLSRHTVPRKLPAARRKLCVAPFPRASAYQEAREASSESLLAPPHNCSASTGRHLEALWIYVTPPKDPLAAIREFNQPSHVPLRAPTSRDEPPQTADAPPHRLLAPFKTSDAPPETSDAPLKTSDESLEVYVEAFPLLDGAPRAQLASFPVPVGASSRHPGLPPGKRASLGLSQPKTKALRRRLDMRSPLTRLLSLALASLPAV